VNPIFQWGLELIRAAQSVRDPALDALFLTITSLGSKEFYFLLLPLMLWCVDFVLGVRVAALFLLSTYVNVSLKDLFALPRPFELDPSVQLYDVIGYGLPSGHAQLSVVVFGALAHALKKAWVWVIAGFLIALIGFSRVYLGVHFPTDVLAGWLIGVLLLTVYIVFHARVERWLEEKDLDTQLTTAVALPLILLLLHVTDDTIRLMGVLLGAGVGVALLRTNVDYNAGGPLWQRGVRFVLGFAVVLGIAAVLGLRFGLNATSPQRPGLIYLVADFLRYAILGLWMGLGAPRLFRILRLTPDKEHPA
jgi:membrane-associated phospholipid phosphatase